MIQARQITSSVEGLASRSEAITRVCEEHSALPASFRTAARDWCVDADSAILTLSTFELWEALERGQVQAWMRVWREGMECWTAVGEIAEFAWALAQTPGSALASVGNDSEPQPPLPDMEPARTSPPPRSSEIPAPPASGVRWVALGSLVALSAVASALVFASTMAPSRPAEVSGAPVAAAAARTLDVSKQAGSMEEAPVLRTRSVRAAHAPAHAERGQERLPRGGRWAER